MRRQRAGREAEESAVELEGGEREEAGERLFYSRQPRQVRRTEEFSGDQGGFRNGYRRVL